MGKGIERGEQKLTRQRLEELLDFESETGIFRWKQRRTNVRPGQVAGRMIGKYRYIRIDNEDYMSGRLAWFWMYGKWPVGIVRYNDGDQINNRPSNLRDATIVRGKHNWRTKEGKAAYQLEYRQDKRHIFRHAELKRKFGITTEEYQAKLEKQNGVCAICGNPETAVSHTGKIRWLTVDHNHITNAIRELLCGACNVMIGLARENPEILRKAAAYLERHAKEGGAA